MPTRPTQSHRKVSARTNKSFHIAPANDHQHGALLFDIPQESLTHITSYLPLPSLLDLALTCRRLCEHVDDDNTWLRAFFTQFLGISPEYELDNQRILLLRRTQQTWRKEFIHRYNTINRFWSRSCSSTVTYTPHNSSIDGVHLTSDNFLLTLSVQYGVVARSNPFNGKVLKGYIDASGTGLGIGNPNAEFTPNVSVCSMTSDGGTARIFWGKRNGEVALTVTRRVMDSLAASTFIRCAVQDEHEGVVQHLVPDSHSNTFLSAGADGRVKLWDTKTLRLLWSTDKQQLSLLTDPFVSIAGSLNDGFVAGALKSGDVLIYDLHQSDADGLPVCSIHQLRVSSPVHCERTQPISQVNGQSREEQVANLWLRRTGESTVLLLVQYTHHPHVYRVHADTQSHDVAITSFGDSSFANVSAVEPVLSTNYNNMVIVGDQLGFVSIYDVDAPFQRDSVAPAHRFEAHTNAVTTISYTPTVIATGTAAGNTTIWDSLLLEPKACFNKATPRAASGQHLDAVSRVLVNNELVVIVVGNHVTTCKLGPANGRENHKKHKHANKLNVTTKGHQQYEMHKDIAESYMELEYERTHAQRIYGREREQRSTLDELGLSELEAVEYVLMLSREEEEARQQRTIVDEGVFEGDFDDLPGTPTSSRSKSTPSTPLSPPYSSPGYHLNGRQHPLVSLPISNEKVQVSPRFVPEPMEAGTSVSPLRSLTTGPSTQPSPMTTRSTSSSSLDHFPAISSSLSSTSSSRRGTSASPEQPRSAWSTPFKSHSSASGPSSPSSRVVTPVIARSHSSNMSLLSADIAHHKKTPQVAVADTEEMDDDLKLAIELSLAEARNKGQSVDVMP